MNMTNIKTWRERVEVQGITPYEARDNEIKELREKLATLENKEPVSWRYRAKADWNNYWSNWEPCSKDQYEDYVKTPKLHYWTYEAQALYLLEVPDKNTDLDKNEIKIIMNTYLNTPWLTASSTK